MTEPDQKPSRSGRMRRVLKRGVLALAALLILAQFFPVAYTNPPVTSEIVLPADVEPILRRSCYDCHSNETVWPWYSRVAPVSWLVAKDVAEGREYLNYSEWGRYDAERLAELMEETVEEIEEDEMPMPAYTWLHPDARLSDTDKRILTEWAVANGGTATDENDEDH
ncbi:MAG: heme-binding domain-containing protein [Gemmatimonadota bacterium]